MIETRVYYVYIYYMLMLKVLGTPNSVLSFYETAVSIYYYGIYVVSWPILRCNLEVHGPGIKSSKNQNKQTSNDLNKSISIKKI